MVDKIDYFGTGSDAGDYSFLSNFFEHDGWTVEHHYQAAKTNDPAWAARILGAKKPGEAKKIARDKACPAREDWFKVNLAVMKTLLRLKFAPGSELARRLLLTGSAYLVEGNWWGDDFWGVDSKTGEGANWLGRLLMEGRDELKAV